MSLQNKFTVGLVQMALSADTNDNLKRAITRIEEAAGKGAQLICLPELFRSHYFCQTENHAMFDLAEPVPGPTTQTLADVAKKLRLVIIAPVFERRAAGLYHNSAVILDSTGEMAGL